MFLGKFGRKPKPAAYSENDALITALLQTQAVIWFDLDGIILDANDRFLATTGYARDDIIGKHHQIFVPPEQARSADYQQFWPRLRRGEFRGGTFERRAKDGRTLWLEATYSPVSDADGTPVKVIKTAVDVTQAKTRAAAADSALAAIGRSQAMIEFDTTGKILSANDLFLKVMGYQLSEITGRHHSIFADPGYAASPDYTKFWQDLAQGTFRAGEFKRRTKTGQDVWLQASYNPILDPAGRVCKVLKFATDITAEKMRSLDAIGQLAAISRSQAVIEFDVTGRILTANANFLSALGYRLDEVQGQNHAMFVDPATAQSADYRTFWQALARGEYQAAEYCRLGKNGRKVWIQASYNPIFDTENRVLKVVKYATDITQSKMAIAQLGVALDHLADGNLATPILTPFPPDFEPIRLDFNNALSRLSNVLTDVIQCANSIHNEAGDIRAASDDLSLRTERQAATLEETAGAIGRMTQSVAQAASQAVDTSHLVTTAKTHAEHSGEVVREAVTAMNGIAESSARISRITSVIDEIAFQTNLLALNAGVEAARAGDAGRGFAVVASEVRALAQRSSDAAREIAELITASGQHVQQGVALVGQAGLALTDIETSISNIHARIVDLATASRGQASGLSDINAQVAQLDQVTQRNAAMFEETNAATASLTTAANDLMQSTARFVLPAQPAPARQKAG